MAPGNGKQTQPRAPALSPQYELHPAAAEAAATYSEALKQRDRLIAENARLEEALAVERRHCKELENSVDYERQAKEYFQRFAVEINTHLENSESSIVAARKKATIAAQAAGKEMPPSMVEDQLVEEVDETIKQIAQKFAPKPEQPNVG